jgi:hypothetical protein
MAVTILANPSTFAPAYNPMYFYLDSTLKTNIGFRYVVDVMKLGVAEPIGSYRLRPIPTSLHGELDISKVIQTQFKNEFRQLVSYGANDHQLNYRLKFSEEYFVSLAFSNYAFAGASSWANFSNPAINPNGFSRTMLQTPTLGIYLAGDLINVEQIAGANFRPELDGIHTVLDVFTSGGNHFVVLDLLWIGSGAASTGAITFADGRKSVFDAGGSPDFRAYKGAFKFADFMAYVGTDYQLGGATKKLLTTLPDGVRISNQTQSYFSCFPTATSFVVFNIAGMLYRYALGFANTLTHFQALPTTANITQEFTGGAWVAFTGTIDLTNVDSYTVTIKTGADAVQSETVTVDLYTDCDFYNTYEITFLDRLGSWITIPFNKGAYMQQDVQRESFRRKFGSLVSGAFNYKTSDNGLETYHVEENITYTVNTGILSETESQYMRELISTPQAYVSINGMPAQSITIVNAGQALHLKRTQRDRKISLQFTMSTQDEING